MSSGKRRAVVGIKALAGVGLLVAGVLMFAAPGTGGAQGSEPARVYPARVSSEQAHQLVKEGALLLDVRTPGEYAAGHVDGAVNIPFDQLSARQAELGAKTRAMVLYCHSGRRTGIGAKTLQDLGFTQVYDLGPMSRW
ncbi:MAG: rhodanese-like domain-containing protein [Myxococcales bacterium]